MRQFVPYGSSKGIYGHIASPLFALKTLRKYSFSPGKSGEGKENSQREKALLLTDETGDSPWAKWLAGILDPYSPSYSGKTLEEPSVILNARR